MLIFIISERWDGAVASSRPLYIAVTYYFLVNNRDDTIIKMNSEQKIQEQETCQTDKQM